MGAGGFYAFLMAESAFNEALALMYFIFSYKFYLAKLSPFGEELIPYIPPIWSNAVWD